MNKIITLEKVNYEYTFLSDDDNEIKEAALHDINLDINEGEFLCIIGRNGSGKSTLAKLLNGLILPTEGVVTCFGLNTKDENSLLDIRKKIGMVFQNPDNQIVASLVEEDVAFGLENIGIETNEMRKRVDEALSLMGLSDYKASSPNKLSGGQKQRVALAGILAMKSKVIVLDEPTSMLDKKARQDVINTIVKLNKEENITIILITHYMNEVLNADRVLLMDKGKIIKDTKPVELFKDTDIEKYGIELPSVIKIRNELIKKGIKLSDNILNVDDLANALTQRISD